MENTFKYGKFEGTLDLADYAVAELWENALEQFKQDCQKADSEERGSAKMKGVFDAMGAIFDTVFPGQNASKLVLDGTTSLSVALEAVNALIKYAQEAKNRSLAFNMAAAEFTPKNRTQRRSVKK